MANFQKLEVYIKGQKVVKEIYRIMKLFPKDERFGLIDQIRRAAVSITCNIAEGSGRYHSKDYAQFLRIARGSSYEVISLLDVALDQKYIAQQEYNNLFDECEQINKMLNGFIKSLQNRSVS